MLGGGGLQVPLIKRIEESGWCSVVVDANPQAPGKGETRHFIEVSTRDAKGIIQAVNASPLKGKLNHCVTVGTDMTPTMAEINEYFELPGLRPGQSELTSHKYKMREFLKGLGLRQPAFFSSPEKDALYDWVSSFQNGGQSGGPLVIKPVDNMGGRGVLYFEDPMDLAFVFEKAKRQSPSQEVIVEEYIPGDEISVDALVYEGKCFLTGVADRIIQKKDGMYFIETGHNMPTSHSQGVIREIKRTMQRIADALGEVGEGGYHGALKGDLKYTPQGELIVGEVAARLSGGFMSTHTFPYSTGVDLMKLYLDLVNRDHSSFFSTVQNLNHSSVCIERSLTPRPGEIQARYLPDKKKFRNTQSELCDFFVSFEEREIFYPLESNVGKYAHAIIRANDLKNAQALWEELQKKAQPKIGQPTFQERELRKQAQKKFNPKYCWACKICDGMNCASSVPGMGAVGNMQTFQDNIKAVQNIKILPSYLEEKEKPQRDKKEVSIETHILGTPAKAPILTAPITGSTTNMGGSISEWDYAFEMASAAKSLGLVPTFGDGASPDKYWTGLRVIQKLGIGFPVFKPRAGFSELENRIQKAERMGAKAWGMDVDGVWFRTMQNKGQATKRKTYQDLIRLKEASALPFFLKGIMGVHDAEIACEAGARGIIVSNHGGRVIDSIPASATVLPSVAGFVKKNYPHVSVLVDGGIRSGNDVFKMIALGAQAVLIGRPVVIAAVAYGRFGVYDLLRKYMDELKRTLKIIGLSRLKDINKDHVLMTK